MDLLAKNTLIATKDAGKLPVDWQSRLIPALRRYWQAVQAHPGCFALVTAMTPNQAVASILSKDEIPTLSGELVSQMLSTRNDIWDPASSHVSVIENTHALFQLEDIVRTKFSGNASGTQLNNIINNPPYVLLEVPPAVARKVNSPYGDAIPLMRSVQNFNGFHVWLEQSAMLHLRVQGSVPDLDFCCLAQPLKTPTPNFLTVRCSDRWVLDLADLNVEIPLVCKDKLARFALDYFAVYGCLPLGILRSLLYAVGCIPPVSSSKYGPLPVYQLLELRLPRRRSHQEQRARARLRHRGRVPPCGSPCEA